MSFPLWAPPNATRLLRSTSVVTRVEITDAALSYTAFDARAIDRLRVAPEFLRARGGRAAPTLVVTAAGHALSRLSEAGLRRRGAVGWAFDDASGVLDVAHNASDVRVYGGSALKHLAKA